MLVKIFFSYAHEDEQLRKGLELQLRGLARQDLIEMWHDRDISAGTDWKQEINEYLNSADIILLLVSPNFIDLDYCYSVEMMRALERHERKEAVVIPVILRPIYWHNAPFGKLQSLPTSVQYVTSSKWFNQDEAFFEVAEGIRSVIDKLSKEQKLISHERINARSQNTGIKFRKQTSIVDDILTENFKLLCPACIEAFYPGDCRIISQVTGEVLKPAPSGWMTKQLSRRNPELLTTPQYLSKMASRECPNCGYLLPYNIELAENVSIAVVGDIFSGKSSYIASLIYLIETRWAKDNNKISQITCLTEDIRRQYTDMIQRRQTLNATQPFAHRHRYGPLIYEIKLKDRSKHSFKRINLILYDGSGEDQSSVVRMEHYARYVLHANAIIFLIDPFSISEIYNKLPDFLQLRYKWILNVPERSYHLVNSTIELFKSYYGSKAKEHLQSIPIAMMLSKSDMFKYVVSTTSLHGFLSSCKYSEYVDLQDIGAIDKEVRALIRDSSEHILLRVAQKFSKVNFFATSATGCEADESGQYPFIDPCRCLDPLLWILYQLDMLQAK